MAVIHSYSCLECDAIERDRWSDDVPVCCGVEMSILFHRVNSFEWGSPRTYVHLRDEPFSSRSELNSWAKANNMSLGESSEKVRGSRNDMYDSVGKSYSYSGASGRDNPLARLPRRH